MLGPNKDPSAPPPPMADQEPDPVSDLERMKMMDHYSGEEQGLLRDLLMILGGLPYWGWLSILLWYLANISAQAFNVLA